MIEYCTLARWWTTPEGDPYIAMEYVRDGLAIDEWCRRNKVPLAQKLQKFQAICSAVQHATSI